MRGPEHRQQGQEQAVFKRNTEFKWSTEINRFISAAIPDALSRLPENASLKARERVINGIMNNLPQFVAENNEAAQQVNDPEYEDYKARRRQYPGVKFAAVGCSDKRKPHLAIGEPEVDTFHRRPGGIAEITESSSTPDNNIFVMGDYRVAGSINYTIESRTERGEKPDILEMEIIHTDCGASKAEVNKEGCALEGDELEMASIELALERNRDKVSGFNTDINRAGGKGATLIAIYDIASQGLIFGVEHVFDERRREGKKLFDRNRTLQQNFDQWEKEGKILKTETLDKKLLDENLDLEETKKRIDIGEQAPLDIKNPSKLRTNTITIGDTAEKLTRRYEASEEGFSWIPERLLDEMPDQDFVRALAFRMIFNSSSRILRGVKPGQHDLMEHPERFTIVSPKGGDYNENHPGFLISFPGGQIRDEDKDHFQTISGLAPKVAKELGITLSDESRLVIVGEEYDADDYNPKKPKVARKAFHDKVAVAKHNARSLRNLYPGAVADGRMVVISALFDHSGSMTEVLSSLPQSED